MKEHTRLGFQADWKDREIYTALKYSSAHIESDNMEFYEVRVGFAPYIAGYDELNAWVILQVQNSAVFQKQTVISPILRMFYKNVLWEIGSSLNGAYQLNFMARY